MADLECAGLQHVVERGVREVLPAHVGEEGVGHVNRCIHHRPAVVEAIDPAAAHKARDARVGRKGEPLAQFAHGLHAQLKHLCAQRAAYLLRFAAVAGDKAGAAVKQLWLRNVAAAAADAVDEPVALQAVERMAQRGAADAHGRRQFVFCRQAVAGVVFTALDLPAQGLIGPLI